MTTHVRLLGSLVSRGRLVLLAAALAAGCAEPAPNPEGPTATLRIAALSFTSVTRVCYDLRIENQAGDPVWSRGTPGQSPPAKWPADSQAVCSDAFGNAAGGDITYIAPCDASLVDDDGDGVSDEPNTNRVLVWVDGLYGSSGADLGDWRDPCPNGCRVDFDCRENADTLVPINLTLMRDARQGFFDIAVNFDEVFCSAKLDCVDELLHNGGIRDTTAVVGFACTSGAGKPTHLYLDDIVVTCAGAPTASPPIAAHTYTLVPHTLPDGQHGPVPPGLFQFATYVGREALPGLEKCYWNSALGLDLEELGPGCTLSLAGTASRAAWPGPPYTSPADTIHPYLQWQVPITDASGALACGAHPLDGGNGVSTQYTGFGGRSFAHTLSCGEPPLAAATFVVGEHGAAFELEGVRVQFPPGAVAPGTVIGMEVFPPPPGAYSNRVRFGPGGLSFDVPVLVSFAATSEPPAGTDLLVFWSQAGGGALTPTWTWYTVGANLFVILGYITHFSEGLVGGAPSCHPPTPYRCGDGRCVATHPECNSPPGGGPVPPNPCPPATPVLCNDGSCKAHVDECGSFVASCPSSHPMGCLDGRCVAAVVDCICRDAYGTPCSSVCPPALPVNCGGTCLPPGSPCGGGPCPGGRPLCPDGATCAPSNAACPNSCESYGMVTCSSGLCRPGHATCVADNGCPDTRPFRCSSDPSRCEALPGDCAKPTCEASGQTTCWLNGCQASPSDCLKSNGCTEGKPIRCGEGTCVADRGLCLIQPPMAACEWIRIEYPYFCGGWIYAPNPYRPFYASSCGYSCLSSSTTPGPPTPFCGPGKGYCKDMDACIPATGTCRDGRPPCGDGTFWCESANSCVSETTPCDGVCANLRVLCAANNTCLEPTETCGGGGGGGPPPTCEADEWVCNGSCFPRWAPCDGVDCPSGHSYCPGESRCKPTGEPCEATCQMTNSQWMCGPACLSRSERCGGQCHPGYQWCANDGECRPGGSLCTPTCDVEQWACQGICIDETRPCGTECPPNLKLCYFGTPPSRVGSCVGLAYSPCDTTP